MIPSLLFIILIILLLILIILLLIYFSVRGLASLNTIGINNVTLSITPAQAACGTANAFTCTIAATGWADNSTPRNYLIELRDSDIGSDLLETFNSTSLGTGGISPVRIPRSVLYRWSITKTMNLSCDAACNVKGTAGSSGESEAEVFARFRVTHGNPFPEMDSQEHTVKCVAESGSSGSGS